MTMMIDRAGKQTPDMTGLARAKGGGKPRIYKMATNMWMFEYSYAQYGSGSVVSIQPSWCRCIVELQRHISAYNLMTKPWLGK